MEEVKAFLHEIDTGCEHGHYTKLQSNDEGEWEKELLGHPIQCAAGNCKSCLRLLRQTAVHFPKVRNLLVKIYSACASSKLIYEIDAAFGAGNIKGIKEAIKCENLCDLLLQSTAGDKSAEESTPFGDEENTETALQVKHADTICEYEKKLEQDPEFACCSCERLLLRKNLTMFKFHDEKFSSDIWNDLKYYLIQNDPGVGDKLLYVCTYCRPILNSNKMPSRCVLNGFYTVPVPENWPA